jgi:drug/metabolite transporter (DMT)-like permease
MASVDAAARASGNRRGISAVAAAMAFFVVSDTLIKLSSAGVGLGALMTLRCLVALALLGGALLVTEAPAAFRLALHRSVVIRAAIDACGTLCFLVALIAMPLADLTAVILAVPLILVPVAAFGFRERVGRGRWIAAAIGFLGVLLVVQPQGGWGIGAAAAIGCTLLIALREALTRRLPSGVPTLAVSAATMVASTTLGLMVWLSGFDGGHPPGGGVTVDALWVIAGAGLFSALGNHLNAVGFRAADLSAVAPFRYTNILWALVAGWLVWSETPTATMLVGAALILASGLYVLRAARGA